ncbi:uncharacterized protein LOC111064200 [Nilaparvata lugens]|uniref:uncharacterized protein LOC111064200 n=1 Tax=Nilaparvata lugens TaxID=108931 RepID=UPI00193DD4FF|nr:uncharacterized protein LOC111064200 [Nilaparvata lugens]XP_039293064.1 uncharacterized protein LOC111064200 [Nilaparvata lugens]XP_039293066.1 uncharacterized protein LOC111064200 [Nilaparvata lugens]XP_039293067.1 uncharacterized protein LOC111064200 [Nilaparvata lugens]
MTSLALGLPIFIVTILGLLINGYIFLMVLLSKQIQTANNLLLLHLGLIDSLLCLLVLASGGGPGLAGGRASWPGLCTLHGFLFTLLHPVALWTVCGLNCDRYCAISAPLHYSALVSPRRVAVGLGAGWALALVLSVPPLLSRGAAPFRYDQRLQGCAPDFGAGEAALWYSAFYTLFTLVVPALLILGCNLKVLMIARYHRHRIASAIFEVTLSAQVTITHQRNPFFLPGGLAGKFKGRSAATKVLQLLGSFVVLYFPFYACVLWEALAGTFPGTPPRPHPHIVSLSSVLLACSPPVNGLLYGVKSKVLRKSFQNYWRKQMTKSEINQEIQARTPSACGSRRPSLTPLGLLGAARPAHTHAHQLQRRLSEAAFGGVGGGGGGSGMQRIASEMGWRPHSTSGLAFDLDGTGSALRGQHAASFSTLQVPTNGDSTVGEVGGASGRAFGKDELIKSLRVAVARTTAASPGGCGSVDDGGGGGGSGDEGGSCSSGCSSGQQRKTLSVIKPVLRSSISNTSLFVQRVIGATGTIRFSLGDPGSSERPVRRSPKILITRAFSEESDQKTPPSPDMPVSRNDLRKHSSSASTLVIGNRWRNSQTDGFADADDAFVDAEGDAKSIASTLDDSDESAQSPVLTTANGLAAADSSQGESGSSQDASHEENVKLWLSRDGEDRSTETTPKKETMSWPFPKRKARLDSEGLRVSDGSRLGASSSLTGLSDAC